MKLKVKVEMQDDREGYRHWHVVAYKNGKQLGKVSLEGVGDTSLWGNLNDLEALYNWYEIGGYADDLYNNFFIGPDGEDEGIYDLFGKSEKSKKFVDSHYVEIKSHIIKAINSYLEKQYMANYDEIQRLFY